MLEMSRRLNSIFLFIFFYSINIIHCQQYFTFLKTFYQLFLILFKIFNFFSMMKKMKYFLLNSRLSKKEKKGLKLKYLYELNVHCMYPLFTYVQKTFYLSLGFIFEAATTIWNLTNVEWHIFCLWMLTR